MKVALFLLILLGLLNAQVVVPEKGWRKIGEGKGKVAGLKTLGVWDNTDDEEGDVMVGVAWGLRPPTFRQLLGLIPGEVASGDLIVVAEILEEPWLGWLIQYRGRIEVNSSRQSNYWIYGNDGGVLVQVIHDKDTEFSLEGWNAEGIPEDEDGEKRKAIKKLVDAMNATKALPTIKIDEDLKPVKKPVEKEGAVMVEIKKEGAYWFEGKKVNYEDLLEVLKAAVLKFENKEPVIEPVLHIRAEKELEFKYVQRVIKAGAAAGIKRVAYAAFGRDEE